MLLIVIVFTETNVDIMNILYDYPGEIPMW